MSVILAPLASLLYTQGGYWWATWQGKWAVLLLGVAIVYSLQIGKRTHWSVAPFLCITLCSGIYAFAWSFFSLEAAYPTYALLALVSFFSVLNSKHMPHVKYFMAAACMISSVAAFFGRGGFVGNPSMNGTLIAITLPMAVEAVGCVFVLPEIIATLGIVAIFHIGQSIPIGVLCVVWLSFYVAERRHAHVKVNLFYPILLCLIFISVAFIAQYPILFDSNGRFNSWKHVLSWWWSAKQIWFGLGTGSSLIIFRGVNALSPFAHNDYLQVLFENGIVGMLSVYPLLWYALVKAFNRPLLFASVCAYAAAAFFNYPSHLPVHAFIGVALVWLTHYNPEKEQ